MEKEKRVLTCIVGPTVRSVIQQANELEIQKEDIISMFALGGQVYLCYYK